MRQEAAEEKHLARKELATFLFEQVSVADLANASQELRKRLSRLGVELCCGGAHTLSEMSKRDDFPLQEVLKALESMLPKNPITPSTLICDLAANRHAEALLSRYGIGRCAAIQTLNEEVSVFARVHDLPLPKLIAELNLLREAPAGLPAATRSAAQAGPLPAQPADPFAVWHFLPFVRCGTLLLLLGAFLGLLLTVTLAQALWPLFPSLFRFYEAFALAHAYLMAVGFVLSFVVGVALHALPRFLGTPIAHPHLTSPLLLLLAGSVIARLVGILSGSRWLSLASALLLVAAVFLFLLVLFATIQRSSKQGEPHIRFMRAALFWLVGSCVLFFFHALTASGALHRGFAHLFLFGFVVPFVFGFAYRTHPAFLRLLPPPEKHTTTKILWLYNLGLGIIALSFRFPSAAVPGMGLIVLASYLFVLHLKVLKREGIAKACHRPPDDWMMRTAYWWLLVALPLLAIATAEPDLLPIGFHMLTIGFLLQMIVGMAWRVLPAFSGQQLWGRRGFPLAYWSLNIGVLLRAGGHLLVAVGLPAGYLSILLSGLAHFSTLLFFAASLQNVLLPKGKQLPARAAPGRVP